MLYSDAYNEGIEAFNENLNFMSNPYPENTTEHKEWYFGWCKESDRDQCYSIDEMEYLASVPDYDDELIDEDPFRFTPYKQQLG